MSFGSIYGNVANLLAIDVSAGPNPKPKDLGGQTMQVWDPRFEDPNQSWSFAPVPDWVSNLLGSDGGPLSGGFGGFSGYFFIESALKAEYEDGSPRTMVVDVSGYEPYLGSITNPGARLELHTKKSLIETEPQNVIYALNQIFCLSIGSVLSGDTQFYQILSTIGWQDAADDQPVGLALSVENYGSQRGSHLQLALPEYLPLASPLDTYSETLACQTWNIGAGVIG